MHPPFRLNGNTRITFESLEGTENSRGYSISASVKRQADASAAGAPAPGGAGRPGVQVFGPQYHDLLYNNIAQLQLPRSKQLHNKLMKQIYDFDPIAGPAVDLFAELPWSGFHLAGIDDPAIRNIYEDAMNNLRIENYLPQITANWLVYGRVCLHFLFDAGKGVWSNFIQHDDDDIRVYPNPFINENPLVDLMPSAALKEFILRKDDRAKPYLQYLSPELIQNILAGKSIPLDNSNTLYLPRRMMAKDYIGTSLFTRIIGLVVLERALFNASVAKAQRGAGVIRVLKMGRTDPTNGWIPTDGEVNAAVSSLLMAEEDPVSAVVAFKTQDITIESIAGSGAEGLWKISDEAEFIQNAKFKALGINESMLSGDATYNNLEQAISLLLDKVKSIRSYLSRKILIETVFEPLAKAHGFREKGKGVISRRAAGESLRIVDSLDSNLILPTIEWIKPLEPRMDQSVVDLYEKAEEKGLPIPLRKWSTVFGLDISEIESQAKDDLQLRKKLNVIRKSIEDVNAESGVDATSEDSSSPESDMGFEPDESPDESESMSESEGPAMEKVEPSDDSVVDKVPAPPEEKVKPEPSSTQFRHPLMTSSGFGKLSRTKTQGYLHASDIKRKQLLRDMTFEEQALAKYLGSYYHSKITMNKREVRVVANMLRKQGIMDKKDGLRHITQLHVASADAGLELLTGVRS